MSGTPDIPRTKAEALALALEWGHTRSHLNAMMAVENYIPSSVQGEMAQPDRQATLVATARADAAEVERLAALHAMLPDRADPPPSADDPPPRGFEGEQRL